MAAAFCSRARERLPSMQLATGDSVTRTPLVCATRVVVLNVSIVRSRGPRGGMSNDLILATRTRRSTDRRAEARPTIRTFLAIRLSNVFRNDTLCFDSSFFSSFENNETRSCGFALSVRFSVHEVGGSKISLRFRNVCCCTVATKRFIFMGFKVFDRFNILVLEAN